MTRYLARISVTRCAALVASGVSVLFFACSSPLANLGIPAQPMPNLGIDDEKLEKRAAISLRTIRVRNLGFAAGEAVLSVAVIDSFGTPILNVLVQDGVPIHVPAVHLGGAEGRTVPIAGIAALDSLVGSLLRSEARFGLRAILKTAGTDAVESDNVKTRWWADWLRLAAGTGATLAFKSSVPQQLRVAKARIESLQLPFGALIVTPWDGDSVFLEPGFHVMEVQLFAPKQIAHGSVFAGRLTLTDSATGAVLQQHDLMAAYDTVPPTLSSYRAVILRDRRVAIQVHAGDRHSGISESGVATVYSLDGGLTFRRQVHDFIYDDFGRPALFEAIIGPFGEGADLILGISARDLTGNTALYLPKDASVFVAPKNAERSIETIGNSDVYGNPIFAPLEVTRTIGWLNVDLPLARLLSHRTYIDLNATERFELRRLRQLAELSGLFSTWAVDASRFERLNLPIMRFSLDQSELDAYRIRMLR